MCLGIGYLTIESNAHVQFSCVVKYVNRVCNSTAHVLAKVGSQMENASLAHVFEKVMYQRVSLML